MSKTPINEAILSQVLHYMRNGQLRRCIEMGLEPEILAQLQQPSALSLLLNTPVSWCSVTIDGDIIKKLLTGAQRSDEEVRMIERALRLGATTQMLQQFFGLSPQDVALQRLVIGVTARRGRWREFSEEMDAQLWYRWTHLMKEHQVELDDSLALLDVAMLVAEELNAPQGADSAEGTENLSLAIIWHRVQSWIREGLYPPSHPSAGFTKGLKLVSAANQQLAIPAVTLGQGDNDL
ncbi:DUF2857 domain-containing protein [Pseudomonas fluorescens]|jgi:hypothetical protein|uniref:DUF2857 domain-containing protein n=1 Tax=Pseudomonas lurida TaxID=244566 RepID=A0ABY9FX77_9PSED|nr:MULTISPECIES: DUF2857 domain-containing protein [Pseudomonas]MBD8739106.1 DUF2857 domain-containing protein [Pseudomonas fluorescens]MBC3248608.1 DUF2857 domain-containing protein [Pseudomonas lurida]NWB73138.1 DUF2857 domain-containing protein [Pseudomonas sp. G5001]TKK05133.1 DUF2857 domain-containing protein [Pseudomonas fluorescens]WLH07931.1 DUF2857 domain-containing protein [Pseudomonas lurida]